LAFTTGAPFHKAWWWLSAAIDLQDDRPTYIRLRRRRRRRAYKCRCTRTRTDRRPTGRSDGQTHGSMGVCGPGTIVLSAGQRSCATRRSFSPRRLLLRTTHRLRLVRCFTYSTQFISAEINAFYSFKVIFRSPQLILCAIQLS